jgi:hypothetical protein
MSRAITACYRGHWGFTVQVYYLYRADEESCLSILHTVYIALQCAIAALMIRLDIPGFAALLNARCTLLAITPCAISHDIALRWKAIALVVKELAGTYPEPTRPPP